MPVNHPKVVGVSGFVYMRSFAWCDLRVNQAVNHISASNAEFSTCGTANTLSVQRVTKLGGSVFLRNEFNFKPLSCRLA